MVEEVLDQLHIDQCSIMAHSAGAPYALAFANKYPERIRGDICLLAPWVGGGEGCKHHSVQTAECELIQFRYSGLQVAQVRTQRYFEDRTSSRVEGASVDAWKTTHHGIRRDWV